METKEGKVTFIHKNKTEMLNLIGITKSKKMKTNKVGNSYNRNFTLARLNLEVLNQEEKFGSTRELLDSLSV
ncbi:MAG: hypothetical protein OEW75_09095 [Cyclobacteriaceae bacterium]|nr:hypothetical protein [Cyclobacteriaceae bacterium]